MFCSLPAINIGESQWNLTGLFAVTTETDKGKGGHLHGASAVLPEDAICVGDCDSQPHL